MCILQVFAGPLNIQAVVGVPAVKFVLIEFVQ